MNFGLGLGLGLDDHFNPSTQIPPITKTFGTYENDFNFGISSWQWIREDNTEEAIRHAIEAGRRATVCRFDGNQNETQAWRSVARHIRSLYSLKDG